MIALGGSWVFPVDADSIVTYTDLTPEQTLALYGNTISGSYWTGSDYEACSFTYCYTLQSTESNPILFSSRGFDDAEKTYMSERKYLVYKMDGSSLINDDIIVSDKNRITLQLRPSISISGITYFRQFLGFAFDQNQGMNNSPIVEGSNTIAPYDYNYISSLCTYSPTPVVTHYKRHYYSSYYRLAYIRFDIGYDVLGQTPPDVEDPDLHPNCSVFDVYLQNLVDGQEQTFDFTGQELSFSGAKSVGWTSTLNNITSRDRDYLVYLSCPRVTDGYVLPEIETTAPNYSEQLDDISSGIGANTSLLQQILAKLDLIYQKMQQETGYNPSLTPASTIPRDLQQYYSGVASGAPSASAINDYTGGASIIPFSSILSASGLGGLFGVLVAVACAGWVLTRGRGG